MVGHASTSSDLVVERQHNSYFMETSSLRHKSCEICKVDRAYTFFFRTSVSGGEGSSSFVLRSRNCRGRYPSSQSISDCLRFRPYSLCPGGVQADQGAVLASARSLAFDVCPREEYVAPGENATKALIAPLLTSANVSRC